MAIVNDIMFCAGVTHSPESGVTAHAITDVLRPRDISKPFSFVSIVTVKDLEFGEEYKLKVRIINESSDELAVTEGMLPMKPMNNVPKEHQGIHVALVWKDIILPAEGVYTIQAFVNGEILKVQDFYVKETVDKPVPGTH